MSEKAKKIVANLSIDDKISLLAGADYWNTKSVQGVPPVAVSDGPHGLRRQNENADNLGINDAVPATCFPNAVNVASSFDTELANELGKALGAECHDLKVDVLLGPGVNIKRSPLCGRNFEYFTEDPYLSGVMAASLINGVQSTGIGTSIKHFACNNQELRRNVVSSVVDERTMREIYLSAFEYAVKHANPRTVMCAYNKVNGVYCSENKYLLDDILRKDWGFKGLVMSDWGAVVNRKNAVEAGLDLEMPPNTSYSARLLKDSLASGELDEKYIDISAERVVDMALKADEASKDRDKYNYDRNADHELARRIGRESMVLLKNNGILPLDKSKKIVFVGEFAEKPRYQGGGSSHVNTKMLVSPLEYARKNFDVDYVKGYEISNTDKDENLLVEAIERVGKADVAVVFLGLPERIESEGYDRKVLEIPHNQTGLIRELCKVQDNLVVVLFNGSPVTMPWIENVSAVLEAYLPGEAVGESVCDLLYGDYSPCGKLAETFPLLLDDNPSYNYFPGDRLTVEYREGIYVGYRYYDKVNQSVQFPFGYGLTYSNFEYSDFKLNQSKIGINERITATVTVTNTGNYTAKEIVQIYVKSPDNADVFMPEKILASFKKVELKPSESMTIELEIDARAFQYFNVNEKRFVTLGGDYKILSAKSSRDICAELPLTVKGEDIVSPYNKDTLPSYFSGRINNVSDEEFKALYGAELPPKDFSNKSRVFTIYDTLNDTQSTPWGRRIMKIILANSKTSDASLGDSDIFLESMGNTPFAILPAMSGNAFTIDSIYDLLNLINGKKKIVSIFKLLKAAIKALRVLKH